MCSDADLHDTLLICPSMAGSDVDAHPQPNSRGCRDMKQPSARLQTQPAFRSHGMKSGSLSHLVGIGWEAVSALPREGRAPPVNSLITNEKSGAPGRTRTSNPQIRSFWCGVATEPSLAAFEGESPPFVPPGRPAQRHFAHVRSRWPTFTPGEEQRKRRDDCGFQFGWPPGAAEPVCLAHRLVSAEPQFCGPRRST